VIQNPDITEQTLKNAPDAVHCTGRIGVPSVDFDMRKLPTIVHEMSRSRSLPEIAYKADNFQFRSLELLNRQGLAGNTFRFPFPYELRNVAGSSSSYNVELFVRDQWYFTGYNSFDSGTVEIPLRQPQR